MRKESVILSFLWKKNKENKKQKFYNERSQQDF